MNLLHQITEHRIFLLSMCMLASVIRIFFFVSVMRQHDNVWMYPDSTQYYDIAKQLMQGNGFAGNDEKPQMYRLPGYPLFIAAGLLCGGIDCVLWLQLLLSCLIPLLIFLLARVLFPLAPTVAYVATVLSCLHAGFIIYAGMLTSETLCMIFLLLFFITCLPCLAPPWCTQQMKCSWWRLFVAGALLGLASLIRPIGLYAIVVTALLGLCSRGSWIARCTNVFGIVCGWCAVVTPWLIRNFLLTGSIFFHTLPGLHFLQYSAASVIMERDHCAYGTVRPMLLAQWQAAIAEQEKEQGCSLNDYQRCCCAESLAYGYLKQYPWLTIKTSAIQIAKTCCGLYCAQPLLSDAGTWPDYTEKTTLWQKMLRFLQPQTRSFWLIPLIYWEIGMWFLLLLGLLWCLVATWYDRHLRCVVLQVLPLMLMFVGITLAYGCARLRMPIEPFIIIFSVVGWLWICGMLQSTKNVS